jgi:hypothetical protein
MRQDQKEETEKQKSALVPVLICGVVLLVLYSLSVPFCYLIVQAVPSSIRVLKYFYYPLEWLYKNVEGAKLFFDWYHQFFPWLP